jgi:PAS domain S-box-containing protein
VAASLVVFLLVRRYGRQWERASVSARESDGALRRSEARFRSLVESVPGVVWLNEVDRDDPALTHCVYVAPQLEDLLGYTPQEWMEDEFLWRRVIHPDDLPAVMQENGKADGKGTLSMEYRAFRRDGGTVWIHDEAILFPGEGDRTGYWQGIMVDITATRVQDQALHELTESLRGVFQAAPLAILVLEPDGRVRYWNPAAERIFGWTAAEVLGRPLPYIPHDKVDEHVELRVRKLEGEGVAGFETARLRKDGSRVDVSLSTGALLDADGNVTGLLGVLEDVTERKRVADELSRRQLQQEALAGLGLAALEGGDLQVLLDEASHIVADTLGIPLACILELLPDDQTLLFRSGVGWEPGLVGEYRVGRGVPSLSAYTLQVGEPVVVKDLRSEPRFPPSPNLVRHGVVSGVGTVIYGGRKPYGVLEALAAKERPFTRDDVRFLQGIAATLGLAIERDRAQTALREAEEKYRSLVEDGPAIVYIHDPREVPAHITYIGPQIVDLLGYPYEAWTDDPLFWMRVAHPDDRQRLVDADTLAIEHDEALDIEYRFVAADGREVWVHDRAMVIRDASGDSLFRQGIMVDITERRRAEQERRNALERQLRLATRLELLHQIDRAVLSSELVEEMSGRALEHLRSLVPYDRGSVAAMDPSTGRFSYIAIRQSPELGELVPDLESHVPDEVSREILAQDVLVTDLDEVEWNTPYVQAWREIGIRSAILIALHSGGTQVGTLGLTSTTAHAFDDEAFDIAKEVGAELAIAISQSRLRQAASERAEELLRVAEERQQMLHRIVRAQEEERERVALELHDGLGQILTSISLFASDLQEEVGEQAKPRAARLNELARRAIGDSRQLVWSLRPPELERLGLVPALRRLADEVSVPELTVDLLEEIGDVRLEPESEAVVYRVIQEAVHNAQKHAGASAISILLQRHDGELTGLVEDNGRGFDPAAVPPDSGLGLIGMRERAELVRGKLVVESAIDAGTRVRLAVPIGATSVGEGEGAGE